MNQSKVQFRNLIFEGGGIRGIAYIGAMEVLQQRGFLDNILRLGGTSAGAINALIYSLGYSIREQHQILDSTDFREFMDDSFGIIRDIRRLVREFGWYRGDFVKSWLGGLVRDRLGSAEATFADLKAAGRPDLYVIGANLTTGYSEVFSAERHPDMPMAAAVRVSMSIPLFFAAVRHGPREDVYVDGGVQNNYPVKLFDRLRYVASDEPEAVRRTSYYNKENARFLMERPSHSPYIYNRQTLGLRLDTAEEIARYRYNEPPRGKPVKTFTQYARALISAIMKVQENQHLHSDDWQRTLYINTLDVATTDFTISDDKKAALIEEGIKGAENYLGWFQDPKEQPVNRLTND